MSGPHSCRGWINMEGKKSTDINSIGGHRSAAHWAFEERSLGNTQLPLAQNPPGFICLLGKNIARWPYSWSGNFCMSVILLVGLGPRFVFAFEHLKVQWVLGLSIITISYWLWRWLIRIYLLHLLLPQIAPYSNWGHKIIFPSLAGFVLDCFFSPCFTGSPSALLWGFYRSFLISLIYFLVIMALFLLCLGETWIIGQYVSFIAINCYY